MVWTSLLVSLSSLDSPLFSSNWKISRILFFFNQHLGGSENEMLGQRSVVMG